MGALLLAAVLAWPPWQTVAQDASICCQPLPRAAFIAGNLAATAIFRSSLREHDRAPLAKVDFRRNVVVAAFTTTSTPCYRLEIVNLRRKRTTLTIDATVNGSESCIFALGLPYHVIAVPRWLIGRPLPRRVVLRVQPAANPRETAPGAPALPR